MHLRQRWRQIRWQQNSSQSSGLSASQLAHQETNRQNMIALLAAAFSGGQLQDIARNSTDNGMPALAFSGTMSEVAGRIVIRGEVLLGAVARGVEEEIPTRPQLSYLAAASRKQRLVPTVRSVVSKAGAMEWISQHGDYRT